MLFVFITFFIYITVLTYVGLTVFCGIFFMLSLNNGIFCITIPGMRNIVMDLYNVMFHVAQLFPK